MSMLVKRYFVERRPGFDEEAKGLLKTLQETLGLKGVTGVRLLNRYDIRAEAPLFEKAGLATLLAEPPSDVLLTEWAPDAGWMALAFESLPGQYDQRADSCAQCLALLDAGDAQVRCARVVALEGALSDDERERLENYLVNPVDARLVEPLGDADFLDVSPEVDAVSVVDLIHANPSDLKTLAQSLGLAMGLDDLLVLQAYFKGEGRNPTETEVRVLDTYWSDHCRHTTFNTTIASLAFEDERVKAAHSVYRDLRRERYGEGCTRPETLMDIATLGAKVLKARGVVKNVDESEEINACSVKVKIETDKGPEDWLYLFKNETHNHPTEIEPFGGAATCLGGAIRDPLSGRAYVYQGLRLTGAADPTVPLSATRRGKRAQRQLCQLAAKGFSAYGNQIGLATGLVDELYHPGYEAKRMEVGAVIGAVPLKNVRREVPRPGDWVILIGGRTGRDGCGGATGSSKTHTETSIETAGAEVQKGNAVEERKIQRLFRRPEVARAIRRCNDFGAGGVSVSIGELADGIRINLDAVPKKYVGLNGTELAVSESQERMSCVIDPQDWPLIEAAARDENVEATKVAVITEEKRLVMTWRGDTIVDLDRAFLDSAGAKKTTTVVVPAPKAVPAKPVPETLKALMEGVVGDLNVCAKTGLIENFDASIGSGTVLHPLGGERQETPAQVMASLFPVLEGTTTTASLFTYGFNPYVSDADPYRGAYEAVLESLTKLMAAGFTEDEWYLSLQEYFPSLKNDPRRWGRPVAALLGALRAQMDFEAPAIGGKDSMSGSFENLDVPASLISFATGVMGADRVRSSELKGPKHTLYRVTIPRIDDLHVDVAGFKAVRQALSNAVKAGHVLSSWALSRGGLAEGLFKMGIGNDIGVALAPTVTLADLVAPAIGTILVESDAPLSAPFEAIGETTIAPELRLGDEVVTWSSLRPVYEAPLRDVYPTRPAVESGEQTLEAIVAPKRPPLAAPHILEARPLAVIPVFPGTNCEVDTARALSMAGAEPCPVLVQNLTPEALTESVARMEDALSRAHMLVFPGGFSFGDEPDGSGKYIAAFFRHEALKRRVEGLLTERDGLILGICNGFQALVKLGLLPYGEIGQVTPTSPTLTFNTIGRHQSRYVKTRICSVNSPWLTGVEVGDVHTIVVSHGEGRFVAPPDVLSRLIANGQVATQYVNGCGIPSMDPSVNPNGSSLAIEGLLSADGRIFGKMGHSERVGPFVAKNIPGAKYQSLFESGVRYFTGK